MTLYLVVGPPAAGKSTWTREHAREGDIVIDYDRLAEALTITTPGSHDHTATVKAVTKRARQAAIDAALTLTTQCDVYVIHSTPSARLLQRYRAAGAQTVTIDPGIDVVLARAKRERPWQMQQVIKKWYADQTETPTPAAPAEPTPRRTTTQKGLGWDHQQVRDGLLRAHVDGSPCWWCDRPMYRDRTRNWDHDPDSTDRASGSLAADHSVSRNHGGTKADRLMHERCNKARQAGDRDHLRPTATQGASEPTRPQRAMAWPT